MAKINFLSAALLALAASAGPTRALLDPAFKLGEVYSFPNPARGSQKPTVHVEVGLADSLTIEFMDIAGQKLGNATLNGQPRIIDDGKGAEYAYEYTWDTSTLGTGGYVAAMTAHKAGYNDLQAVSKIAVLK